MAELAAREELAALAEGRFDQSAVAKNAEVKSAKAKLAKEQPPKARLAEEKLAEGSSAKAFCTAEKPDSDTGMMHLQVKQIMLLAEGRQGQVRAEIRPTTPLRWALGGYCARFGVQASRARLRIDGVCVAPDATVEMLWFEDGDRLVVASECTDSG